MKRAIVVGSGAGGATAAKELQGHFNVTVFEAGREFRPFSMDLAFVDKLKRAGLFFDEREISFFFPFFRIHKSDDRMVLVTGKGTGGTTTMATGNALRMDHDLKRLGINLDPEFEELYREIPIHTEHRKNWGELTHSLFRVCREMDLNPQPTPKMGVPARCLNCGRCVLGCPNGAKWDSRRFLDAALSKGADILTETAVEGVAIEGGEAKGVYARKGWRRRFFPVDLVVLAAGGLATPLILDASGIRSEPRLFVDPVLCVATRWDDAAFNKEIPMPFVVQMDRYILSPYFDYLSYFFNRRWKRPAENILSLMIKLSDDCAGSVSKRKVGKVFTGQDRSRLDEARRLCLEILGHLGVKEKDIFLGTINAGHPGGMLPLTRGEAESFHDPRLPRNVYVADATLFPASLGNPPILTIMAMAKRVCRICKEKFA